MSAPTAHTAQSIAAQFRQAIPKMSKTMHKGQNGRISLVGGSREYAGAPFFASMSALRVGADLAYVLTTTDASPVIKSYSPELIVLPILDTDKNEADMSTWISKSHSLIVGPGLGRTSNAFKYVQIALKCAQAKNIPVLIDADGLFLLCQDTSLVKGYAKCILTPNVMEFKLLYDSCFSNEDVYDESKNHSTLEAQCEAVKRLAQRLDHVTVIKKGASDIMSDGRIVLHNDSKGSLKRCGGIGDILSGVLATFSYWCHAHVFDKSSDSDCLLSPSLLACYSASDFVKDCSHEAFKKFRRATLAVDIIEKIAYTFYDKYDRTLLDPIYTCTYTYT